VRWYWMPWIQFALAFSGTLAVLTRLSPGSLSAAWPSLVVGLGLLAARGPAKRLVPPGLGVCMAVLFLAHADLRDVSDHAWVERMDQRWETCLSARVGETRLAPWGSRVDLKVRDEFKTLRARAVFRDEVPLYGMEIKVCGDWQGHLRPSTPWAVDQRSLLHRRGYVGRGVVKSWELIKDQPSAAERLRRWVSSRQMGLERGVVERLENPWAGLVLALTTGNKAWMDEQVMQAYSDTGTSHVLAISGLHFGVVAGLAWWVFVGLSRRSLWICRLVGARRASVCFVFLASATYVLFVGAPISAQRASVGVFMLGAAVLRAQRVCPFHVLSAASVGVLMMEPTATLEIAFQLSFSATFGILLFNHYRPSFLRPGHSAESRTQQRIRGIGMFVGVSVAASLATLPPLMAHFGFISMWSIPLNLIVVPMVSLVVFPLLLIGHAVSVLSADLGAVLLGASVHPLILSADPLFQLGRMNATNWVPGALPPLITSILSLSVLLLLVSELRAPRVLLGLLVGGLSVFMANQINRVEGKVVVDFIDVGQGDSTLVRAPDFVVLVDAGGKLFGRDPGRAQVVPYLRQIGVKRVDLFIITHADLDHRGGALAVLDLIDVGSLMIHPLEFDRFTQTLKQRALERGADVMDIQDSWERITPEARLIARVPPDFKQKNDRSIVLEIDAFDLSVFLTGDLEEPGEKWWVQNFARPVDFLKMPHHGSHSSSTPELLAATSPRLAMSSAGVHNSFNHPRPDVLERYARRGVRAFHTHEVGTIRAELAPGGLQVFHPAPSR